MSFELLMNGNSKQGKKSCQTKKIIQILTSAAACFFFIIQILTSFPMSGFKSQGQVKTWPPSWIHLLATETETTTSARITIEPEGSGTPFLIPRDPFPMWEKKATGVPLKGPLSYIERTPFLHWKDTFPKCKIKKKLLCRFVNWCEKDPLVIVKKCKRTPRLS